MFAGKKSAQIREILISESAWEEMTCLFAPSLMLNHGEWLEKIHDKKIIINVKTIHAAKVITWALKECMIRRRK